MATTYLVRARTAHFARAAIGVLTLVVTSATCRRDEPTAPMRMVARSLAAPLGGAGRIAFSSNADGTYHIYTMAPDGSSLTQITSGTSTDRGPAWSPDGQRIAFISNRSTDGPSYFDVYVMNADGTGVTRVTQNVPSNPAAGGIRGAGHPAWSPDGQRIAFAAVADGTWIFVVNVDGSALAAVTHNADEDLNATWSPDGTRIAFERYMIGVSHIIYSVKPDGTDLRPVTDTTCRPRQPVTGLVRLLGHLTERRSRSTGRGYRRSTPMARGRRR